MLYWWSSSCSQNKNKKKSDIWMFFFFTHLSHREQIDSVNILPNLSFWNGKFSKRWQFVQALWMFEWHLGLSSKMISQVSLMCPPTWTVKEQWNFPMCSCTLKFINRTGETSPSSGRARIFQRCADLSPSLSFSEFKHHAGWQGDGSHQRLTGTGTPRV